MGTKHHQNYAQWKMPPRRPGTLMDDWVRIERLHNSFTVYWPKKFLYIIIAKKNWEQANTFHKRTESTLLRKTQKRKCFPCNVTFSLENTAKCLLSMALTFVNSCRNITSRWTKTNKQHLQKKKFSFYFFGWVLKHFGEQNSQHFPHFFQTTLLNLPNWRLHVHGELHDLCSITPVGGLGQKIHWSLHLEK